jgi:L-rhamnose isomerase
MLQALLEPTAKLREYEKQDKNFERMAYLEELKGMPWNALYNYYCNKQAIPVGDAFIKEIQAYESEITSKRN